MSSLEIFNFLNHRDKCRCCLRPFDEEDDQIKVTKIVQNRFLELTQLDLQVSDSFSSLICEQCHNQLRNFSSLRKELMNKQLRLYEFEEDLMTEGRRDSSDRDGSEEVQTLNEHDDDSDDCVELVMEVEECVLDDDTAIDYKLSSSAQTTAGSSKMFRNQESKELGGQPYSQMSLSAHGSNKGEAEMSQHEIVEEFEDHSFVKTEEPGSLERGGRPKKGQGCDLRGKSVTPGKKKSICNVCGKSLSSPYRLKSHIDSVHLKITRFQCDICGWKFYLKHDMKRHVSRHIDGKPLSELLSCYDSTRPFPCNAEGCGKFFTTKWKLDKHSNCHSTIRYECHCGKDYKRTSTLERHQKKCTSSNKF